MNVETHYLLRREEPRSNLRDLDAVVLTADVRTDDGDVMKAGTEGTVVGIWRDGAAYEVEFPEPMGALATVPADQLRRP
ncbi:DUF4926 domain-containing protein [Methylobacterium iners]|nr:DUF4926 domain-containing protein [Methylobacterium iners]